MSFITSELNLLTDWFRANKLSLNESKTKLLVFRTSRIGIDYWYIGTEIN